MNKQIVAAFDFDGTITKRDTLLPFLRKYGLSKLTKATCKASLRAGNRNFRNNNWQNVSIELVEDFEKFDGLFFIKGAFQWKLIPSVGEKLITGFFDSSDDDRLSAKMFVPV